MAGSKSTLLIVEDDTDVADMLNAYFSIQGYEVFTVNWGEDAVKVCRSNRPDLIILDIRLPDIDGFEVARRLRSNQRTEDIPIIFLTEKRTRADRLQGLEIGADDYITKPFDVQELRLRVRNALRRSSHGSLTNPVTHLPEGVLVDERLSECLDAGGWAIMTVTLENLDAFREAYGFVASDDLQRAISMMIQNSVRELGKVNDFIGQMRNDQFILITTPDAAGPLKERISSRLDQTLEYFYPLKDRQRESTSPHRLKTAIHQQFHDQKKFHTLAELKAAVS
jgi:DNA-binding response OmpR family regulator